MSADDPRTANDQPAPISIREHEEQLATELYRTVPEHKLADWATTNLAVVLTRCRPTSAAGGRARAFD